MPGKISGDDLAPEIASFDPSTPVEDASTPPASWYVNPRFLALETTRVFPTWWLWAGRAEAVANPGSYTSSRIAGSEHVTVRDGAGTLRAFHNVCRHHAACIVEGDGTCAKLVCPYHGWTYGLNGRLEHAPRVTGIRDFDREDIRLPELGVAVSGPLVFVHRDPSADPADVVDLTDLVGPAPLRFVQRSEFFVRCNWKVYVDNYLDGGYHVPVLHHGLGAQLDLATYSTEIFARHSVQSCRGGATEADATVAVDSDFRDRIGEAARYAWIYPNLMVNRYGPILDTNTVLPLAHDETLVLFDYWFEADCATDRGFVERSLEASKRVQEEDRSICESVQRGLASGSYHRGRYAPKLEAAMHHFHRLLAADLRRPS